jgi:hypothetical protein
METVQANTLEDLDKFVDNYSDDVLFRGQTSHFSIDNLPSISTSFDRQGCIPSEMGKWCRFSEGVLKYWLGSPTETFELSQAVLQHYGWRSFFVDLTSNFAVASWFGGHIYSQKFHIEMCEDCFENFVWLRKVSASYSIGSMIGNIYVFDKRKLMDVAMLINLEDLEVDAERPRFHAQNAWMIGPLRNETIPSECILAHLTAPHELLAQFAAREGLSDTAQLFPDREQDPVLGSLLDLPWVEIELPPSEIDVPVFKRAVSFPEYQETYKKHLSPNVALYQGHNIGASEMADEFVDEISFLEVPDLVVFGTPQPVIDILPQILEKLEIGKTVCFEIKTILRQAYAFGSDQYCKGIAVKRHDSDLIEVSELAIGHPGMRVSGVGINRGWYYKIDKSGKCSRVSHADECPCGDKHRHEFLFGCLTIVEHWLCDPEGFEGL